MCAVGIHQLGVVTVPHFIVVKNMAQRVPLRAALQRQRHHVVGVTQAAFVLIASDRIGAGGKHGVDRIEAVAPQAFLRTGAVEVKPQRKHFAFFYQARSVDDVLRGDVVQRTDLIVRAPLAPVFAFLGGGAQVRDGEFFGVVAAGHEGLLADTKRG